MIKRQTTKELIAASLKDLSKQKSMDKITVKEITQNCGLTHTTFYNHFKDKYDLIVWIYYTSVEKIVNKIGKDGYEWRNAVFDSVKYSVDNRKFLINAIMHTSGQNSFINNISNINIKILSNYIKVNNNLNTLPQDVEVLLKIYVYGTVCMLCEWLITKMPISVEKFVHLLENGLPEPLKPYLYKND